MKDIYCYCAEPECVCEDLCCQDCDKKDTCENRCSFMNYKEKIYNSTEFLISELEKVADEMDGWLIYVAAEKIRSLSKLESGGI